MGKLYLVCLIACFLLLVACAPTAATGAVTAAATRVAVTAVSPTPTPPPPDTAAAPTRAAPVGDHAAVSEHGVAFRIEAALATEAQIQITDVFTTDSGMDYLIQPQRLAVTFPGSYAEADPLLQRQQLNLETMPQIVVYPAAAYAAMHPLAANQLHLLQALLATQPTVPGGTLPYLPLINAAQVFHSQLAYLPFANGTGVRYLIAFAQDTSPVTNQQLLYTFQGLTEDGRYYVTAFFPVKTAALPDTVAVGDWEDFAAHYATYVRETEAALNGLKAGAFTPDLTALDAVVTSLHVAPDVALGGVETNLSAGAGGPVGPTGVYQLYDGAENLYRLYRVFAMGRTEQVAAQPYPLLPAPDAAHAVYRDAAQRLWLVDLADGSERPLAPDFDLSELTVWGNARTLLLGVYLTAAEREGLSSGHVAALDIQSGEIEVIDEEHLAWGRPALSHDGRAIAYAVSPVSDAGGSGRIYRPESGAQPLDAALLAGLAAERPCALYNPAWSPDGRQLAWLCSGEAGSRLVVLDLARQTSMAVMHWQPAPFGALPPTPVWSSDGKWLALEVWAADEAETGLWVLPIDGTLARFHAPTGHDPLWLNASQLFYADLDENRNGDVKLFDLDRGETGVAALPAGSQLLLPAP